MIRTPNATIVLNDVRFNPVFTSAMTSGESEKRPHCGDTARCIPSLSSLPSEVVVRIVLDPVQTMMTRDRRIAAVHISRADEERTVLMLKRDRERVVFILYSVRGRCAVRYGDERIWEHVRQKVRSRSRSLMT